MSIHKIYTTILKSLLLTVSIHFAIQECNAQNTPSWIATLEKYEIVDSIVHIDEKWATDSTMTVYHMYYHQPLSHDCPDGEKFQLRATLVVRDDAAPATCPNEMYLDGYGIGRAWWDASNWFMKDNHAEIAHRYHGNLFIPEHRYFLASSPESCWLKLDWCNAHEAAQDFHNLIDVLKKVFRGKWAITGISKGGITTAIQHAYFPEDADIFVPNSAPFCHGLADARLYEYAVKNGWSQSTRERFNAFTRELLEDSAAASICAENFKKDNTTDYLARRKYYDHILLLGFTSHADNTRKEVDSILQNNDKLKQYILQNHDFSPNNGNSILNALYISSNNLDARWAWAEYLPKDKTVSRKIAITQEQWETDKYTMAYFYQCAHELGRYAYDIHCLYPDTEMQPFADSLQAFYNHEGIGFELEYPFFKSIEYDNYALFSMVEQKTLNAIKPIVFLYGEDDPWTGAAMSDECINGENVRKYILEAQHHGVSINESAYKNEIWSFIDKVMNSSTGIDETNIAKHPVIGRRNATYNLLGQRVKDTAVGSLTRTKGIVIHDGKKIVQ